MKRIHFFIVIILFSVQIFAQQKNDTVYLSQKDIIGTWQRNNSIVGDNLNQNFIFYKNGTFALYLTNDDEDVRNIIKLKGLFRLNKGKIYFTITSRIVMDGEIETGGIGMDGFIFGIVVNGQLKEIPESNPQELEPCYITVFDQKHIKINNEEYFKIDEKDLQ